MTLWTFYTSFFLGLRERGGVTATYMYRGRITPLPGRTNFVDTLESVLSRKGSNTFYYNGKSRVN